MDTKLKNSKKIRVIVTIVLLLVLTFANVFYFPVIANEAVREYEENIVEQKQVNTDLLQSLYMGTHVMYYEQAIRNEETLIEPLELFLKEENISEEQKSILEDIGAEYIFGEWERKFEEYRYEIDYYAANGTVSESNTAQNLELLITEDSVLNHQALEEMKGYYRCLWVMEFDAIGQLKIRVIKADEISPEMLVRNLKQAESECRLENWLASYEGFENPAVMMERIKNFKVVYGISNECEETIMTVESLEYYLDIQRLIEGYAAPIFSLNIIGLALAAFVLNNPKIWKRNSPYFIEAGQKKKWFLLEPAVLGLCLMGTWYKYYCNAVYQFKHRGLQSFSSLIGTSEVWEMLRYIDVITLIFVIFAIVYTVFCIFCPVFSLGLKEYVRQYSFLYQIFPQLKKYWEKLKKEIEHFNFREEGTETILKLVLLNFVIVSIICCMWTVGILVSIIYSVILFYLLADRYDRIRKDYQVLQEATKRIAQGDLNTLITEDIGVFEPMKEDLTQIRAGLKKAVEEEIKSQRMKTELITNVSHDLKTPLTAITTYVELLKKEDITEEERKEYVSTLERKAMRLKVLIEDLFEVSKAGSNNITLNLMSVDIVKLMKQVMVEHKEKYEEAGLQLYWSVPEEKVELQLDSQKTYRIFENLFLNIQKYAMSGSRVYIEVADEKEQVRVVIKNMSAEPLNVAGEELVERFVRGDKSRNTEGSGLGLAIAKNFTEIQNGSFEVTVDGDLFKTTLIFIKEEYLLTTQKKGV